MEHLPGAGKERLTHEETASPDEVNTKEEAQTEDAAAEPVNVEKNATVEPADREKDAAEPVDTGKHTAEEADDGKTPRGFAPGFFAGILFTLACAAVFLLGWNLARRTGLGRDTQGTDDPGAAVLTDNETLYKLDEVQSLIEQHYLHEVDSETLSSYLFKGVAAGLEDVYASYYSSAELRSVMDLSHGEYFGIGVTLQADAQTGELHILEVYDGGPAQQAGLQVGDILLALNDEPLEGVRLSDAAMQIKSQEGEFALRVLRPDTGEELDFTLECGEVELNYVEYRMEKGQIGYVRVSEFTDSAAEQFRAALQELKAQGMRKLIVDLRNNPGGVFDAVCDMLDEILPGGLIVYTEDRDGKRSEFSADDQRTVDCETAVLVNGDSASASEIFAGAVQDHGLGPIIGTQTYGKGVVQKTYSLRDGSAFKLTVEKYFTPSGQDIDGHGITPDIVVEDAAGAGDEEAGTDVSAGDEAAGMETDAGDEAAGTEIDAGDDAVLTRALEELAKDLPAADD